MLFISNRIEILFFFFFVLFIFYLCCSFILYGFSHVHILEFIPLANKLLVLNLSPCTFCVFVNSELFFFFSLNKVYIWTGKQICAFFVSVTTAPLKCIICQESFGYFTLRSNCTSWFGNRGYSLLTLQSYHGDVSNFSQSCNSLWLQISLQLTVAHIGSSSIEVSYCHHLYGGGELL